MDGGQTLFVSWPLMIACEGLAWIPMDISYPNKKFTPTLVLTAFRICISLGIYLTYEYSATVLKNIL